MNVLTAPTFTVTLTTFTVTQTTSDDDDDDDNDDDDVTQNEIGSSIGNDTSTKSLTVTF